MAEQTGISWTDHTFNPWWGCERVSPACARCYAASLAARYGHGDTWGDDKHPFRFFGDKHWAEPLKWNKRADELGVQKRVFCASMADVFEERDELEEHRIRLFELIDRTRSLDWQILTKRPEFARDWLRGYYEKQEDWGRVWTTRDRLGWGCLPNVWVGVSVENTRWTWRADVLREIPATVRFISAEPLLGNLLDPTRTSLPTLPPKPGRGPLNLEGIDWLIVGGESGAKVARPMNPAWVRALRDEALRRGIAFHFKQWGSYAPRGFVSGKTDTDRRHEVASERWRMFYYGTSPTSGGKLLDGVEWCELPGPSPVLA